MDNRNICDSENNMELTQMNKKTHEDFKQWLFLILIIIFLILLINSITILVKNRDIIQNDALVYGMKQHNFTSCTCFDGDGNSWSSIENGFLKT